MGQGWLLLGVWCGTLAIVLPAQAAGPKAPDSELEEVVVTATRTPMPARQAPGSLTILTREQIDATPFRSGPQIDDLLRRLGCRPGTARSRSSVWGPLRNGVASICSRVRIVGEPGAWRAGMGVRVAVTTTSSSSESGASGPAAGAGNAIASVLHQTPNRSHPRPIRVLLMTA